MGRSFTARASAFARRGLGAIPGADEAPVPGAGRALLVAGGREGVGTSCTTALLAMSIAREAGPLLLVDADHEAGEQHALFGVRPPYGLRDVRDGVVTPTELCRPLGPGLDLLAAAADANTRLGSGDALEPMTPAERRGVMRACAEAYASYRAILVDCGHKLDTVRSMAKVGAQHILVVTTPDAVAVAGAYAMIKGVHLLAPDLQVHILVVRAEEPQGRRIFAHLESGVERFLGERISLAGIVPDDPSLERGMRCGMTVAEAGEGAPAQRVLRDIGRQLVGLSRPPLALRDPGPAQPARALDIHS